MGISKLRTGMDDLRRRAGFNFRNLQDDPMKGSNVVIEISIPVLAFAVFGYSPLCKLLRRSVPRIRSSG
jgi:hypothetical protein